ncbi:MAG: hypothetical protein NC240_10905 [Clostridium sp.]|nr:hypothetical protein [Clostridium sp.]
MVDENRVKLMTKLTIYEEKQTHKAIAMSRFYKRDYVRSNVLRTWVACTVVYWAVFAAYIYMHFEDVLAKINEYDYFDIMYKLLAGYVIFCAAYFVFSSLVYGYRYEKVKSGLAEYNGNLKKLIAIDSGEEPLVKVVDDSAIVSEEVNTNHNDAKHQRLKVNRTELMRKQQKLEEEKKEQEIIENVRKRNERVAEKNEILSRQQREAEEDKRRIRERRLQLEREQMERLRTERLRRMQEMNRQNHTYNDESGDGEGGER